MGLASVLWEENADLAGAALRSLFVTQLASGTLAKAWFRAYVAQDAFFLEAFAGAYASAAASTSDKTSQAEFSILEGAVADELQLHKSYAVTLGVDLTHVIPKAATINYTEFLQNASETGGTGRITAGMAPCMRLYAHIGQTLNAGGIDPANPYKDWVKTYSSQDFEAQAARLERLLEHHATNTPGVHSTYRRAMQLEVDFLDVRLS